MHNELIPIKKSHHNSLFKGFPTDLDIVKGDEVGDLTLYRTPVSLDSNWKIVSIWERIKFLFTGEITLKILGDEHPPVSLVMGNAWGEK